MYRNIRSCPEIRAPSSDTGGVGCAILPRWSAEYEWWDHLVDVLATIGEVTDRDPRGLTVVLVRDDGSTQVVEIDMTPSEWNDMTSIGGWHMAAGAQHVRQLVLDQPRAFRYLTYGHYMLTPAVTDWERN